MRTKLLEYTAKMTISSFGLQFWATLIIFYVIALFIKTNIKYAQKRIQIREPAVTCRYIWHIDISYHGYLSDTQSVKVC